MRYNLYIVWKMFNPCIDFLIGYIFIQVKIPTDFFFKHDFQFSFYLFYLVSNEKKINLLL
jgi:hypothetical protein